MKALLLIAAVAAALSGCAMPSRDSGRDADRNANQAMRSNDVGHGWGRGAYEVQGTTAYWSGGDDTSGGLGWRRD